MRLPEPGPEIFRGLVGRVVETFAPHTEASPISIAAQSLAIFGNAVGRGPYIMIGETPHRGNINILIVGLTSKGRKGDSLNVAMRAPREADPDWAVNCVQSGLSSGEGLIHAVRDRVEKLNTKTGETAVVDEGVSDKRLLAVESEYASVLRQCARDGNILSAVIRDAWDSVRPLRNLTKNSPAVATNTHVSMIGHTTPDDLLTYLLNVDVANGFANRFIPILTGRAQLLPMPTRADWCAVAALVEEYREALQHARAVGEVHMTPAAERGWRAVYPALTADRPGILGALLGRAEAQVIRLCLLFTLARKGSSIDVQDLESALALQKVSEASIREIFKGRTGNDAADRIIQELTPGSTMSLSEIRVQIFREHVTASKLSQALSLLKELGEIEVSRDENTGGRPRLLVTRVLPEQGPPAGEREKSEKGGEVVDGLS